MTPDEVREKIFAQCPPDTWEILAAALVSDDDELDAAIRFLEAENE